MTSHDAMRLLAFGGPLNEQMVTVEGVSDRYYAAVPEPIDLFDIEHKNLLMDAGALRGDGPRIVTYTVEKFGYHENRGCPGPWHNETCRWVTRCLVAEGFPRRRITDALNVIVNLSWALVIVGEAPPSASSDEQGRSDG